MLKQWIHAIGRKNLPVNSHTRICSRHFVGANKRQKRPDEVPSILLPRSSEVKPTRKPPKERILSKVSVPLVEESATKETEVQTEVSCTGCSNNADLEILKKEVGLLQSKIEKRRFCLANMKSDESKICFYTGFPNYATLLACYQFLGPAVNSLVYDSNKQLVEGDSSKRCRSRTLTPKDEFFLVLVRLRLGLMEQDLAYRFEISQSTVSRIISTWINFLYLKFKEIPMWPPRDLVRANMPKQFKEKYPTTRVIIDATEIFITQPRLPELQQMTFSNYKNHNTFKVLVGISPSGDITFVSKLFPGSISDKELTKRSGLLDLLEKGDSVMADRGFDIEEELIIRGVRLNIPPFLRGKSQFEEDELISSRRIASLRIHVERAMERIKKFHIFDRILPASLTDIADRLFLFVVVCQIFTHLYVNKTCTVHSVHVLLLPKVWIYNTFHHDNKINA